MGSDRVRAKRKSSSTLTPGFKPKQFSFLQPRYQDTVETETDSFQGNKQQNSSEQSNPTLPFLGHSFGRTSVLPIQTKLAIGQPGDKYEQEADQVAEQVMRMPELGSVAKRMTLPVHPTSIQRFCSECEEELQRQPMEEAEEEEEENVLQSQPLVKQITPLVQRQTEPPEEEEEEKLTMKPLVQRRVDGGSVASADLESTIEGARGQGQPLGNEVRVPMEQAFGSDFSGVRVHNDSQSNQLNKSIQARAFTIGQDIFFRQGEYQPGNRGGQQLLVHELTHTIQQKHDIKRQVIQRDIWDDILDVVQVGLDVGGLVPGFGAVPDLINAGISGLRGDEVGAGLSLAAAVPGAGLAAGLGKLGAKGAKALKGTKGAKELAEAAAKKTAKEKTAKEAAEEAAKEVAEKGKKGKKGKKDKKGKKGQWWCKCKARSTGGENPPDHCPKFVEGYGKTRGEAQRNAKLTAPSECRKFYGHCDCKKIGK